MKKKRSCDDQNQKRNFNPSPDDEEKRVNKNTGDYGGQRISTGQRPHQRF